jgi:hypothetical protein
MLPKFPGDAPRDLSKPLEQIRILVDSRLDGQRLDLALTTVLTWRSRASIHRLIDGGLVQLNGRQSPASSTFRRIRARLPIREPTSTSRSSTKTSG